ncbi:hypothetical protein DD238_000276 [Peronospora effusa]|uniref:Uncharacterized protein n=1 Tax=Peronospora effusa TaxID=542832 RepID=A0A3M6VV61_9STRA|nr:hypothetical protein DD238_000276 [Peronospora effusa]RQM08985.1 hypothetical protein DD237_000466 [Peronospora effusa]
MRISRVVRVTVAAAAIFAFSLPSSTEANTLDINTERNVATFGASMIDSNHETRMLGTSPKDEDDEDVEVPAPKKKQLTDSDDSTDDSKKKTTKEKDTKIKDTKAKDVKEKDTKAKDTKAKDTKTKDTKEKDTKAKKEKAAREAKEEEDDEKLIEAVLKDAEKEVEQEEAQTETLKKKKKVTDDTPASDKKKKSVEEKSQQSEEKSTKKETKKEKKGNDDDDNNVKQKDNDNTVNDKKIKGNKREGVIDESSEGNSEIDKIDLRNNDGWVSVYDDPPLLVIKASLYAFISYNDTEVCDTFNMTMNAVEQKAEEEGRFSYHVVAYINCTKNNQDETQGRFILNFIPEGKRLLLTECGHREEGEIVNWLRIDDEVPECMTPKERKEFLSQPMKHIHVSNGTNSDVEAVQTDFLTRLEDFDPEEVAIFGAATVAFMAVFVVLIVFIIRKRKAQKDLERTIAGAKAEHAVEDDDLQIEAEEKATRERKGLMDSAKAKTHDPDMEEGSFVNSPAVRV